jgi:glycerophosphoryl diester phosphodiesterase
VPALDEFLAAAAAAPGRFDLYLDAKDIPPEAAAAALARHGLTERAIAFQPSLEWLRRLGAIDPRIRTLAPLDDARAVDARLAEPGLFAVDVDLRLLNPTLVRRCHARGLRVFVDVLGADESEKSTAAALAAGVDAIETDRPLAVLAASCRRATR